MTDDGLTPMIEVVYFAGPRYPGVVADEGMWPYAPESFARIEKWTGMPAASARQALDGGEVVGNALFTFRLVYTFTPRLGKVLPHTPCACQACTFAMTNDRLAAGKWDCHDYPGLGSAGECSDPHGIGCTCLGTVALDAPCEACGLAGQPGNGWETQMQELREVPAEGESNQVIHICFTKGRWEPEHVAGEHAWPYTTASLKKIERITGITPAQARSTLETGAEICTRLMQLRLLPADPEEADALLNSPSPRILLATDGPGPVTLHAPCDCAICTYVATRGGLQEHELDCNDHPRIKGHGRCNDPHSIGCTCLGTGSEGGPCEACEGYIGAPETVAELVARRRRRRESGA